MVPRPRRTRLLRSHLALLLVGLGAAGPAGAEGAAGDGAAPVAPDPCGAPDAARCHSLDVRVVDEGGLEIPGATVTLGRPERDGTEPAERRVATTDVDGKVRFDGVGTGTWTWRVERVGFRTARGRVELDGYVTPRVVLGVTLHLPEWGWHEDWFLPDPPVDTESAVRGRVLDRPTLDRLPR